MHNTLATNVARKPMGSSRQALVLRLRKVFWMLGVASLLSMAWVQPGLAATCRPANLMIVVDTSASMKDGDKLSTLKSALRRVVNQYKGRVRLGLISFSGDQAILQSSLGPENPADIASSEEHAKQLLQKADLLTARGETPLTKALSFTKDAFSTSIPRFPSHQDTDEGALERNYVLLMTDGYNTNTSFDPLIEIQMLRHAWIGLKKYDIKTFVVGLGTGLEQNRDRLEAMAVSGGTGHFIQVTQMVDLTGAILKIPAQISQELCNGRDDNCDGKIEGAITISCQNDCGQGQKVCNDGTWSVCQATQPAKEICDGKDNDCDGKIDDGVLCATGEICVPQGTGKASCRPICTASSCQKGSVCDPISRQCVAIDERELGECYKDLDCGGAHYTCIRSKCIDKRFPAVGCGCNARTPEQLPSSLWLFAFGLLALRLLTSRRKISSLR